MRKLTMLAVAMFIVSAVFAQTKNVNKARTALDDGEIEEAIALIELAVQHEKSSAKGKTWFVRGDIYKTIAMSEDDAIIALDNDAIDKAIASYKKVMELENEGSVDYGYAQMNLDQSIDINQTGLAVSILNKGAAAFQTGDIELAYEEFMKLAKVNPTDTTGNLYAGIAANQLERYDDALKNFKKVVELGYYEKSVLNSIISLQLYQTKDYEDAMEYIAMGKEKYPDENNFNKLEVDAYIKMEKLDEAISHLKSTIEAEPDNGGLYLNLGMLYAYDNKYDEAIPHYNKAIELNPDDFNAIRSLADVYISKGNEYNKRASDMDIKTFTKEGDEVLLQAREWYSKALPLLEQSNELKPDDRVILSALNGVYIRLKQNDKAEEIYNQREKLGFIEEGN